MKKTQYRIKIDCDIMATTPEAALVKLGELLKEGSFRKEAKQIHNLSIEPYDMICCYICGKSRPRHELTIVGNNTGRCPTHTQATIIKKAKEFKKAERAKANKSNTTIWTTLKSRKEKTETTRQKT